MSKATFKCESCPRTTATIVLCGFCRGWSCRQCTDREMTDKGAAHICKTCKDARVHARMSHQPTCRTCGFPLKFHGCSEHRCAVDPEILKPEQVITDSFKSVSLSTARRRQYVRSTNFFFQGLATDKFMAWARRNGHTFSGGQDVVVLWDGGVVDDSPCWMSRQRKKCYGRGPCWTSRHRKKRHGRG